MRKGLVAANWKMHGSLESNGVLLDDLITGLNRSLNTEVLICPPHVYLDQVGRILAGTEFLLGAQNVHSAESGAFTGEVSPGMLKDIGCSHVIIGHSERREIFGESDAFIAEKFSAAQGADLIPILCIGETRGQREAGETERVVLDQLNAVLQQAGVDAFRNAVIAYEPVWAIGTGLTATPEQAQAVHELIRQALADLDADVAAGTRILYGGSVKGGNAAELFAQADIDGGLVGGASLVAEEFITICSSME